MSGRKRKRITHILVQGDHPYAQSLDLAKKEEITLKAKKEMER